MNILVSNVGSTSLKFKLFEMPEEYLLCESKIERVGSGDAIFYYRNSETGFEERSDCSVPCYSDGIKMFLSCMTEGEGAVAEKARKIAAVGFKTVLAKGFYGVYELTDEVIDAMREYLFVAPAHNAPYLEAIGQFKQILPEAKMVGVFETAFHRTIPLERRIYSLPYEWYEKYGIMRMGYHGASHSYISKQVRGSRMISCHLGGSCSVCAIKDGKSVDTSFGFSLQTGVPHANRAGDFDPYIIPFLKNEGLAEDEILKAVAKNGGLLGISGVSNDLRKVQEAADKGNKRAELAIDVLAVSVIRYIGSFYAELGGLDALVFTGGIGENSNCLREKICSNLEHMGVILDKKANDMCRGNGTISAENSPVKILVVAANEEIGVAGQTYDCLLGK